MVHPKSSDLCPSKEKRECRETNKDKGHGKIEVEIGVMLPQLGSAKDCWQRPEARREA